MTINLLEEIRIAPTASVKGIGQTVLFSTLFANLQSKYGLNDFQLLTDWLVQLEKGGAIRLYRTGGIVTAMVLI